jgi:hypothetical protein
MWHYRDFLKDAHLFYFSIVITKISDRTKISEEEHA